MKPIGQISEKAIAIHHDKLYAGYVAKKSAIRTELAALDPKILEASNATYSAIRSLKDAETFAANGVSLHEWYFENIGGNDTADENLPVVKALAERFGSMDLFLKDMTACGMAARGWAVLAWDTHDKELHIYTGDAHNHGGVWGAIPLLVLDVYEHAYFMDYGADRAAYIADAMAHVDWEIVNRRFEETVK